MTTSDWALVISLCSFAVALSSFVWNVWSKFIYPKPKVQVTFRASYISQPRAPNHGREFFTLSATNFGPGDITLHSVVVRHYRKQWWKNWRAFFNKHYRRQYAMVNPLEDFPHRFDHTIGPFSGGLPKKIATGESFNSYFPRGVDWFEQKRFRIGFSDSFDRNHWCSARDIRKVMADTRADKTSETAG